MTFAEILANNPNLTAQDIRDFASFMDLEQGRDFMEDVAAARQ
jgi:hypothetical protein